MRTRACLLLTTLLLTACATAAGPQTATVPAPPTAETPSAPETTAPATPTRPALTASFYFVHCFDGKAWVQLDSNEQLLVEDALLEASSQELRLLEGATDGFVVLETLTEAGAARAAELLGSRHPFRVYEGTRLLGEHPPGAPQLVGRVVPHFGMVQEWSEQGMTPGEEGGEGALRDLRNTASMHLMAPLELACNGGEDFHWARPANLPDPRVVRFRNGSDEEQNEWETRSLALPAWKQAEERVRAAYGDSGEEMPTAETLFLTAPDGDSYVPCGAGCHHVLLHVGSTQCGMGPDEAIFSVLWPLGVGGSPIVQEVTAPLFPILVGDFDGNGKADLVARTHPLSQTVELLEFDGSGFVTVKSTSVTYADCPC
jgi:hypothetical protein